MYGIRKKSMLVRYSYDYIFFIFPLLLFGSTSVRQIADVPIVAVVRVIQRVLHAQNSYQQ